MTADDVMDHPDIDGGWAWLVLGASFLVHVMTYGLAWSTGVYNVIFLDEFKQPKSVTAWAGAMPTAMMYAIGKYVNPFQPSGMSNSYKVDQSISVLRVVEWYFSFKFKF